jgi:choline dehydrogenase-like flavoprotein
MAQVIRSPKTYDVCVIGSGAGGGMATKVLAEGGLTVALLEAGGPVDPEKDFKMFAWPYDVPHRGIGVGGKAADSFGEFLAPNGAWKIDGEPYTTAPGSNFYWFRSRVVGGRTNHWGRIALRFSPIDFRSKTRDGLGEDWPITYEDISPYYDKVESYIGVFGTEENISSAPDGVFLPPPKPRCSELLIKKGCDKLGIPCIPSRLAVLTKPLNGRPSCHYCAQCGRGCTTASNFSSSQVLIPPTMATGKLTLLTNAMAREILVGTDGKATGVSYIDRTTRREMRINARAVVVAASACESARLLLNSKSHLFPDGLANSSGMVGRNLMDSVGSNGAGYFPNMEKMPPHNHDGTGGMHMYIPWWKYDRQNDFPRGYHIEMGGGREMPECGMFDDLCDEVEGYGATLKATCRRRYGTTVGFAGRGEMLANPGTYCEIDQDIVDRFGIPVLRFHFKWGEAELRQAKDMQDTFKAIVEASGGTYLTRTDIDGPYPFGIEAGGKIIHEVGTARMGADPKKSVLNGFCQAHDVKNLFVTDGAGLVTNPDKNPTLTILALSWRASDYLLDQAKKGNI